MYHCFTHAFSAVFLHLYLHRRKKVFSKVFIFLLYKVVLTHLSTKLNTNYQQNVLRKTKQMISSRFLGDMQVWEVFFAHLNVSLVLDAVWGLAQRCLSTW